MSNTPFTTAVSDAGVRLEGRTVAVVGAYGHTGRFVVAELLRRGATPILVGRDLEKLEALRALAPGAPVRVASTGDAASLDRALDGASAVVNAAGPFLETSLPVADAALRAGIPYLDVAAEQGVSAALFDTYGDRAREAGVVIAPSLAFYGGLGDLLATAALGDWPDADEITLAYGLDSWHPTHGTRRTGETNAGQHLVYTGGELRPFDYSQDVFPWDFPEPLGTQDAQAFATADQVTLPRHVRTPEVRAVMNLAPLRDIRAEGTPEPRPADAVGRSAQTFLVEAVVRRGRETRRAVAGGQDIYAVTAPLVAEALERVLDGRGGAPGVRAAGEAFDAADFLRALAPEHLTRLDLPARLAV
ncbi:saccharopine dehydrogenase NADP-binding domain-containing protein [Streptomyces sp. NPDC032198]|uniref:saccharopine dehydrogenase family protein n=1 Tax=Streptomyces sp. NPDC032198 TaxID=3155127 RepID=UPI00340BE742